MMRCAIYGTAPHRYTTPPCFLPFGYVAQLVRARHS